MHHHAETFLGFGRRPRPAAPAVHPSTVGTSTGGSKVPLLAAGLGGLALGGELGGGGGGGGGGGLFGGLLGGLFAGPCMWLSAICCCLLMCLCLGAGAYMVMESH